MNLDDEKPNKNFEKKIDYIIFPLLVHRTIQQLPERWRYFCSAGKECLEFLTRQETDSKNKLPNIF